MDIIQTVMKEPETMRSTAFVAGAVIGIPLSWVSKWANNEVDCVLDMFTTEPRRTVFAMLTNLALIVTAVATGTVPDKIAMAFAAGLLLCGFADSVLNKGKRRKWTDADRKAKK